MFLKFFSRIHVFLRQKARPKNYEKHIKKKQNGVLIKWSLALNKAISYKSPCILKLERKDEKELVVQVINKVHNTLQ